MSGGRLAWGRRVPYHFGMASPPTKRAAPSLAVVAAVAVAGLYFAQEVLIPIALAVLLAFLLAPPATWLERRLGRVASVLTVVLVASAGVAALGWTVGDQVVRLAQGLPEYQDEILRKRDRLSLSGGSLGRRLEEFGEAMSESAEAPAPTTAPAGDSSDPDGLVGEAIGQVGRDPIRAAGKEAVGGPPATARPAAGAGLSPENPLYAVALPAPVSPVRTLFSYLGLVLGPLGTGALVFVFVVFVLLEREQLRDRLIRLTSRGRYTVTTRAINDAGSRIGRYLFAQAVVNGSYGLVIALGLFTIGLTLGHGTGFPSFVLWGALCAVLRFVPYVGPWVAAAFPVALSLAVYPGFEVFAATLGLFVAVELLSNNVMEPWLYGATTGISTVALLAAAVFWTWLWGPVGLVLSTPLTVCLVVVGKHVPQLKFLDVLLGDGPALPPRVTFYQRLLAGDEAGARRVAEAAAGDGRVADEVIVPALRMARRDRRDEELSAADEARVIDAVERIAGDLSAEEEPAAQPARALVLGLPAHHRGEEVALGALGRLAAGDGIRFVALGARALPAEVEARVAEASPAVVVIAVLPPGGLPQARFLCKRLRGRFAELRVVVCYLGRTRQFDRLLIGLRRAGASYVNTTLAQTRSQVRALVGNDLGATKAAARPADGDAPPPP